MRNQIFCFIDFFYGFSSLYFIDFCSDHCYFFLLLTRSLVCSSFPSSLRCKLDCLFETFLYINVRIYLSKLPSENCFCCINCFWLFCSSFVFFFFFYLWLCWVFVSVRGPSPVVASGGHSSSRCAGPSLSQPLLLRSTGSRRAGSAIVAHGPSRSAARGIFPDQGSNPRPPHWQADPQPLRHQGSPCSFVFLSFSCCACECACVQRLCVCVCV